MSFVTKPVGYNLAIRLQNHVPIVKKQLLAKILI